MLTAGWEDILERTKLTTNDEFVRLCKNSYGGEIITKLNDGGKTMDVREKLVDICFREFCDLAGDNPCGCDGCPYGKYSSENGECYEEYKKDKFGKLEGHNA